MGGETSQEIHVESEIENKQYKQLLQYIWELDRGNSSKTIEIAKQREMINWFQKMLGNNPQRRESQPSASIVNGLDLFREKAFEEQILIQQIEAKLNCGITLYKANPVRAEKPEEVGQLLYREIASYLPLKIEQSKQILKSLASVEDERAQEKDKIIETLQRQVKELEELYAKESTANKLETFLHKDSKIQELEMQVEEFKKYEHLYKNRESEFEKIEILNFHLLSTNSELRQEIKQLNSRIQTLEQKPDPKDLQIKLAKLETDNKRLQKKLSFIDQNTEEQDQINSLNDELFSKEIQNISMKQTINDLRNEMDQVKEDRKQEVKNRACHRILQSTNHSLCSAFLLWKVYEPPIDLAGLDETMSIQSTSTDGELLEESHESKDIADAKKLLKSEKKAYLENNEILQAYKKFGLGNEKPMTRINIFKFFEDLMDKKYEADVQDIQQKCMPRSMSVFLLLTLNSQHGHPRLAMKSLSQIIPGLHTLIKEKHQYGTLFCRLLQLFHPDPICFNLAFYITKMRMEFNKLITTSRVDTAPSNQPSSSSSETIKKPASNTQASYAVASVGGLANLGDVLDLVYRLFVDDKVSLEVVLQYLKPDEVIEAEYYIAVICHKMSQLSKDATQVFIALQTSNTISSAAFTAGIQKYLSLQILPNKLALVFSAIDIDNTGVINQTKFVEVFGQSLPDYRVSKAQFLQALTEVFSVHQKRDATRLRAFFNARATWQQIQKDEFLDLCRTLDPHISPEKIACLELQIPEDVRMTADAFTMTIMN